MPANDNRARLNYPQLGRTRTIAAEPTGAGEWPDGFDHVDTQIRVGSGDAAFTALAEGILTWQIQRRAGLRVSAPPRAVPGARITSGFGVGNLRLPVPCEVVWALEPGRAVRTDGAEVELAGFGYGTLPGHPALGEEAFLAMKTGDGGVYFRILAFSKPSGLLFALGAPVTKLTQRNVTRSYLQAARSLVAGK
ncbi:DUF1990 family protein [Arthrobacter sp. ERGS1:01]|uniref:DUF1990 family protein n=1 Tax=Arthrobacter sp. ERGS1:01 TaxID=1704044 RepID=UPI001ED9946F|nr:DUF1990 domain-containing protein [Arthrobacter sp. ERGS1:01]